MVWLLVKYVHGMIVKNVMALDPYFGHFSNFLEIDSITLS